jgi:hypothetical protein
MGLVLLRQAVVGAIADVIAAANATLGCDDLSGRFDFVRMGRNAPFVSAQPGGSEQ